MGGTQEEDRRKVGCEVVVGGGGVPAAEMGAEALMRQHHWPAPSPAQPTALSPRTVPGNKGPHSQARGRGECGAHMPGCHRRGDSGDGARHTDVQRPGARSPLSDASPSPSRGLPGRACLSLLCFPDPRSRGLPPD